MFRIAFHAVRSLHLSIRCCCMRNKAIKIDESRRNSHKALLNYTCPFSKDFSSSLRIDPGHLEL